jgi:hypothetical protein
MKLLFTDISELRGQSDGQFKKIMSRLNFSRIINTINLITTLHNATMLSRSVVETIGTVANVALNKLGQLIGIEDPIDMNDVLGGAFSLWIESMFGTDFITPAWKKLGHLSSINSVLGVSEFEKVVDKKEGKHIEPEKNFLEQAQALLTPSGDFKGVVQTIPGLLQAFSSVLFVRQGLHRLGGEFDLSVLNPAKGKTKITDALGFSQWSFNQIDERLGIPSPQEIKTPQGSTITKSYRNIQDSVEEANALNVAALQDLEVIERYVFALVQDQQKMMQIVLQSRSDLDLVIEDLGCKYKEITASHPTHIDLSKATDGSSSFDRLFQRGTVHYVSRKWDDTADKNQKLERMSYDTQIAAMSSKFELDKTNPSIPLDNSRKTKGSSDEVWRTFVSTLTEPPEGYVSKGNPIPEIKEVKNGNPTNIPKPTTPNKKLGQ